MENRELLDLKNNGTIATNSHVFYVVRRSKRNDSQNLL